MIRRLLTRLMGLPQDDLPYPCTWCGTNVPPFQGVREADVFCSTDCASDSWAAKQW